MIAFMGVEYTEEGILRYVNVGEKSVWSKFTPWVATARTQKAAEIRQKRIAGRYLCESVKRSIDKLKQSAVRRAVR